MNDKSKPVWRIYAFMLSVVCIVLFLVWCLDLVQKKWPQLGVKTPDLAALFRNEKPVYVDIVEELNLTQIDASDAVPNEAEAKKESPAEGVSSEAKDKRQWISYKNFPPGLAQFYDKLNQLANGNKKELVRILHFGDSQIEGDRISGYLRNKLQLRFGGYGVGYMPLYNPTLVGGSISNQGSWQRITNFGNEPTKNLAPFGLWNSFATFSPFPIDSINRDSIIRETTFAYNGRRQLYHLAQTFTTCKLFYQLPKGRVALQINTSDTLRDTLSESKGYKVFTFKSKEKIKELNIQFSGSSSPRLFGISFEPEYGVVLDNVPMRGSSGTFFHRNTGKIMGKMINDLNVSLIILEFGGNVMPYIKDSAASATYARYIGNQIRILQKLKPNVGIVFIGPADMSVKNGLYYETYPLLENVRDELKKVVHDNGAAFWDMYEAMGGKNSMPSWVEASPALAANDYTHFSPKGAAIIAEMFYVALEFDLNTYNAK